MSVLFDLYQHNLIKLVGSIHFGLDKLRTTGSNMNSSSVKYF